VWALSRPWPQIPVVEGLVAYVPGPDDGRPLTPEELQKFPEPLRGAIAMYQDPKYWDDMYDRDDDWASLGRPPRTWWS
jgi:hypothetical protein